jgi:hypothetical protein
MQIYWTDKRVLLLCVKNKRYEANGDKAITRGTEGSINYLGNPTFGLYHNPSQFWYTFTPSVSGSIPMICSDLHFGSGSFSWLEASRAKSFCVFLICPYCYTFLLIRFNHPAISNGEYKLHNSMRNLLLHFLTCNHGRSTKIMVSRFRGCVTIDRLWTGEWIYWPLIHTTRNYK